MASTLHPFNGPDRGSGFGRFTYQYQEPTPFHKNRPLFLFYIYISISRTDPFSFSPIYVSISRTDHFSGMYQYQELTPFLTPFPRSDPFLAPGRPSLQANAAGRRSEGGLP